VRRASFLALYAEKGQTDFDEFALDVYDGSARFDFDWKCGRAKHRPFI
jgi:hypothetical protein